MSPKRRAGCGSEKDLKIIGDALIRGEISLWIDEVDEFQGNVDWRRARLVGGAEQAKLLAVLTFVGFCGDFERTSRLCAGPLCASRNIHGQITSAQDRQIVELVDVNDDAGSAVVGDEFQCCTPETLCQDFSEAS